MVRLDPRCDLGGVYPGVRLLVVADAAGSLKATLTGVTVPTVVDASRIWCGTCHVAMQGIEMPVMGDADRSHDAPEPPVITRACCRNL